MLVKLLSLTDTGRSKLIGAIKALRYLTEVGGLVAAKGTFDLIKGGASAIVPISEKRSDEVITQLSVFFNVESTCGDTVDSMIAHLVAAKKIAARLFLAAEHGTLTAMIGTLTVIGDLKVQICDTCGYSNGQPNDCEHDGDCLVHEHWKAKE